VEVGGGDSALVVVGDVEVSVAGRLAVAVRMKVV